MGAMPVCCSAPEANSPTAEIVLEQWIQREQPWRMGKQPMIRSYFNRKLEGGKSSRASPIPTPWGHGPSCWKAAWAWRWMERTSAKNMAQQIDRFSASGLYLKYATILHMLYGKAFPGATDGWSLAFLYG